MLTLPTHAASGRRIDLRDHRFFLLLVSLVLLLLLSPLLEGDLVGNQLLTLLFTLVMVAAVFAAGGRRGTLGLALVLAVPWLALSWFNPFWQGGAVEVITDLLLIGLGLFVLALVLMQVVTAAQVNSDIICGAIAAYLLIAVVWAVCFGVIEALVPGSFEFTAQEFGMIWTELLYFSLVTLTTLGYGDITPVGAVARIWSALEAMTGSFYLAVLISRLVGLYKQ